ncbi:MAG: SDR family oxidoreductase [Propionibacteriaceae bacterium]|nr:SDR family oxidoreductase [Propionibacteriaceae bacterium]
MHEISQDWVIVLGATSSFGSATLRALAQSGFNVYGIFFGTASQVELARALSASLEGVPGVVRMVNANAVRPETRVEVIADIRSVTPDARVKVLLHSLAFGSLGTFIHLANPERVAEDDAEYSESEIGRLSEKQISMTMDVMATSMLTWTRDLYDDGLLARGSQVWGMTSAGDTHAMDAYGAVSMAKAALAAIARQLAFELAQDGVSINLIRAGVTRSPALLKIPGHVAQTRKALAQNPSRRLTVGEDVAAVIAALAAVPELWLNGDTISVDGGEIIV